jgi:hypothetical protein
VEQPCEWCGARTGGRWGAHERTCPLLLEAMEHPAVRALVLGVKEDESWRKEGRKNPKHPK